jgi:hypothetical protein
MRYYKFALWKSYFDRGYSVTSYFKYLFAIVGIAGLEGKILISLFLLYGFSCFVVGWIWYHFGIATAEQEVANNYNLFVEEMRKKTFK